MKFYTYLISILTIILPFQKSMAQKKNEKSAAVLNHIAVYVAELNVSTDFYKSVFDLAQIPEPFHDNKHTWFSLGNAGQLHLIEGARPNEIYDKNAHLCFSVFSIDDFINKLKTRNIEFENWAGTKMEVTLRVDGVKQIYFKDPDGHWLEVNNAR